MKSFAKFLNEVKIPPQFQGRCNKTAWDCLMNNNDHRLVHAIINHPLGKRFSHAWTEDQAGNVHDYSQGDKWIVPKAEYYNLFKPEKIHAYSKQQAAIKGIKTGHLGPWEDELYEENDTFFGKVFYDKDPESIKLFKRILPAIREIKTGKITVGKRGQDHPEIAEFNAKLPKISYDPQLSHREQYGYDRTFYDPLHSKVRDDIGLDAITLMSMRQRAKRYGPQEYFAKHSVNEARDPEQFKKDLEYLKKERENVVPALLGRHTGKMILGKPKDIHWEIGIRNGINVFDMDDWDRNKPIITGFYHKKNKKFINTEVSTLDLLSPLQRLKRMGNEETLREYTDRNMEMFEPRKLSPKRRAFFGRIIPALRHTKTGKILTGKRGDWHPKIAQDHGIDNYYYGISEYQRGFIDPKTKKFHFARRLQIDAASLGDFDKRLQKRNFRQELNHYSSGGKFTETLDYDSMVLRSRIVPAIKMHDTGKVYIGKRGGTHPDIWNQKVMKLQPGNYYQWGDPAWAKANNLPEYDDPPYDRLYHDPVTKKNYDEKEFHLDSTELMTNRQWLRWQQRNENYPQMAVASDANPEDMEGAELLPPIDKFPPSFIRKKRKLRPFLNKTKEKKHG